MGFDLEAIEAEVRKLRKQMEDLAPQISGVETKYEQAKRDKDIDGVRQWAEERRQLREEKLQIGAEKAMKEKLLFSAGSQFLDSPPKLILELPHEFYEAIGCRTSSPQTDGAHQTVETKGGDEEQSELEEEREEEDEQEELSIGGSKVDIAVAEKALDRYGFGRLVVKRIRTDGTSARKFAWRKETEDDSRNMDRAVLFVQAALSKTCSYEFAAVDVSRRSVVSQSKATPNKKTASRQTRTDILLCPPDLSKEAQKNPRACLSEALGLIDLKKPENMIKTLRFNRGQGLSQYILCTTTAGHEVPTMLTDLGGHTRIYHSAGDADARHVEEVVFHNFAQASEYFGALINRVQNMVGQPTDLEAALEELERTNFGPKTLAFGGDDPAMELLECEYREAERESIVKLPPFGRARDFLLDMHQGVLGALDSNREPTYIS